jgi:hypothetical protein|nr:MAG TPA: hypothetical protein [Caudoviricetes sp.]
MSNISTKAASFVKKTGFQLRQYSPEILVVAGVIGTVVSAVMACKATTKVNDILEQHKEDVEKIHTVAKDEKYADEYTESDMKKDLTIVYAQTALKFAKLYGPAVLLGSLSITGILTSNNILRKRNIAIATAYAALDKSFKGYRERLTERYGETVDRELKYGIKAQKIEETVVDENGKTKKTKTIVPVVENEKNSVYARFFDETNPNWEKNPDYNLMFLRAQENYANQRLRADGYLFLNDVYESLGIPKCSIGQVVGWIYDPEDQNADCHVSFGIYDLYRAVTRDFVNGFEPAILLDFNVDGVMWDKINQKH